MEQRFLAILSTEALNWYPIMDFIISLAHFCEIHGPTSILCTQVIPPACGTCYQSPPRNTLTRSPSTPQLNNGPTPPQSSHGPGRPNTTSNTPIGSPAPKSSAAAQLSQTNNPSIAGSTRLASPSDTPPASPRSPNVLGSRGSSVSSVIGGGSEAIHAVEHTTPTTDSCRNCSIIFPKQVDEKLNGVGIGAAKTCGLAAAGPGGKKPPLRTTEVVVVGVPTNMKDDEIEQNLSVKSQAQTTFGTTPEIATHTHTVTYLSSRSPAQASRFSNVRQACIRTLSCELVPAQTAPIMFGDSQSGYTVAFVFKLSDSKARGGRRTYALLCMSMSQKSLIQSWSVVVSVFQGLVHEIQHAAAETAARNSQALPPLNPTSSVASRGPEVFLRRRVPGDGSSQRSLADLVGKDLFFVDIHAVFVRLLSKLTKIYGYGPQTTEFTSDAVSHSIGSSIGGRSRASSISSHHNHDRKQAPTAQSVSSPPTAVSEPLNDTNTADSAEVPRKPALGVVSNTTTDTVATKSNLSVNTTSRNQAPASPPAPPRRDGELVTRRQVAVG